VLRLRAGAGVWQAFVTEMLEFALWERFEMRDVESDPMDVCDFLEVDLEDFDRRKGMLVLGAVEVVEEESCSTNEEVLMELLLLW